MVSGPPLTDQNYLTHLSMVGGHPAHLILGVSDLGRVSDGRVKKHSAPSGGLALDDVKIYLIHYQQHHDNWGLLGIVLIVGPLWIGYSPVHRDTTPVRTWGVGLEIHDQGHKARGHLNLQPNQP